MKQLREEFEQADRKAAVEEHKKIDQDFSLMLAKKESEHNGNTPTNAGLAPPSLKPEKKETKSKSYESTAEFNNPDGGFVEIINSDLVETVKGMSEATKAAVFDKLAKAVRSHLMPKKQTSVSGLFESRMTA